MTKYIDKAAMVAEIERRIKINKGCMLDLRNLDYYQGKVDALSDIISLLDTLEVKEVDLEKEFDKCCENYTFDDEWDVYIARHFFKLGFQKAQKGE